MKQILFLTIFASITLIGRGQTLLLQDTFDRGTPSTPVTLNGASPSYSASSETWTSDPSITTNGTSALVPGTSTIAPDYSVLGYIGIPGITGGNLTIGQIYTLQFTFLPPGGNGPWTAAGFGTETNPEDVPYVNGNDAGFWCLDNGNGVSIYYDATPGNNTQIYYTGMNPGTNIVDLTVAVGATSDTLSASINGTPLILTTSIVPPLQPISQVFIGDAVNTTGSFENLSVTEGVPEPSTYAMMLIGLGTISFCVPQTGLVNCSISSLRIVLDGIAQRRRFSVRYHLLGQKRLSFRVDT
jgi:hypothetical protein